MQHDLIAALDGRNGHFRLESGHHGDLWLNLELLCVQPRGLRSFTSALATRLAQHGVEAVCAPLIEGAFVGVMVAAELGVDFYYADRIPCAERAGELFPVEYRVPTPLRSHAAGKSIAIVNDVTNAGSAVRGTVNDLEVIGARPCAIGSLLVLGMAAAAYAATKRIPLEALASVPNTLWTPDACPLCAAGIPLEDLTPEASAQPGRSASSGEPSCSPPDGAATS